MNARTARTVGFLLLCGVLFGLNGWVKVGDADAFFHVASGEDFLAHGLPLTDRFSYASGGRLAYAELAADVLSAWSVRAAGYEGYAALHVLILALVGVAVGASIRGREARDLLVVAAAASAAAAATSAKPQLYSYLGVAALLAFVVRRDDWAVRLRDEARTLLGVFVAFAAWGWLHRGGTLGVVVLLGAAASAAVERDFRAAKAWLACAGVAVMGLLCNPGGAFYLTSTFDLGARSSFRELLADWRPPTMDGLLDRHLAIVPLAAFALLGVVRAVRAEPWARRALVACIATAAIASRSARFVPFAAITLVPLAEVGLGRFVDIVGRHEGRRPWWRAALAVATAFTIAFVGYEGRVVPAYRGLGISHDSLPVDAVRFLAAHPVPGRLYDHFDFGGYVVGTLGPDVQVLIDGRNDTVYSDAFFRECSRAVVDAGAFDRLVQRFGATYAMVPFQGPGDPRYAFLRSRPDWSLIYVDDVAAIYVHREPRTRDVVERLGFSVLRLDTLFPMAAAGAAAPDAERFAAELVRARRAAPHSLALTYAAALEARARGDGPRYAALRSQVAEVAAQRGLTLRLP